MYSPWLLAKLENAAMILGCRYKVDVRHLCNGVPHLLVDDAIAEFAAVDVGQEFRTRAAATAARISKRSPTTTSTSGD